MPTFIAARLLPAMTRIMDTAVRDGQAALLKSETTAGVLAAEPNYLYGLPPQGKGLIDSCGKWGEPAVVYPASVVGS